MAFSAFGIIVTALPASAEPFPTLRVLILNETRVPPNILALAQAETVRIYAAAEVDLVWVMEPEAVSSGPGAFALIVAVKRGTHGEGHERPADVMGVAPTTREMTGKAYVFYDKIDYFAQQKGLSVWQILGHVMAHELGHLLLGRGGHSTDGIMRGEWDQSELNRVRAGRLTFTKPQAEALRRKARILTPSVF